MTKSASLKNCFLITIPILMGLGLFSKEGYAAERCRAARIREVKIKHPVFGKVTKELTIYDGSKLEKNGMIKITNYKKWKRCKLLEKKDN